MKTKKENKMKKLSVIFVLIISCATLFANVDATVDNIRIEIEDYTGAVTIYRKSVNDRFVSVFDSKTFTKTPAFHVFYNGAVLPVNFSGGFKITSSFKDTRATLVAELRNKIELTVHYDLFSASEEGLVDSVKVTSQLVNLSKGEQEVAVKAIFDTWLGESTVTHFTTARQSSINSETLFTNIANDRWIQSANSTDVIRFIVPEQQFSNIDSIIVANKNLLSQLVWDYNIQRGREFHSLNSYNNSALSITWKNFIIDSAPSLVHEFYILTGETSIQMATTWPPESHTTSSHNLQSVNSLSYLSEDDMNKILEILDTINELKDDNTYLSEQEIISLNQEVDEILENARR